VGVFRVLHDRSKPTKNEVIEHCYSSVWTLPPPDDKSTERFRHFPADCPDKMAPIKSIEYFRVKPRWLFVKIVDENGQAGWGEGTLEGHTLAVEGALDELKVRLIGLEAK
jgi:hypothetical protein